MPPGWNQIRSLLIAAAFTPAELEAICQAVFGSALTGITTATDASEQAGALVDFAIQYGLLRELADMVLWQSARRPAVQNLLLSDDMQAEAQSRSMADEMQRVSLRQDRMLEQQAQMAATLAEIQRWTVGIDSRLHTMESRQQSEQARSPESLSTLDRAIVAMMTMMVIGILAVGIYFVAAVR